MKIAQLGAMAILVALLVLCAGCTATQQGAGIGAALGAGTGALIGGHHHRAGGALVGAAVGGLAGALTGDAVQQSQNQRRNNPPRDPGYYGPPPQLQQPQTPAPSYYPNDVR